MVLDQVDGRHGVNFQCLVSIEWKKSQSQKIKQLSSTIGSQMEVFWAEKEKHEIVLVVTWEDNCAHIFYLVKSSLFVHTLSW